MCQLIVTSLFGDERSMTVEDSLGIKAVCSFQWSPDEEHVIYTVREWNKDDNKYVTHIYRISREGGEPDQLTRGKKSESNPRISPDGNYLAFQASRGGGYQIWLLPLTGIRFIRLSFHENGSRHRYLDLPVVFTPYVPE